MTEETKFEMPVGQVSTKMSEIDILKERIEKLEKPMYESGYLRSKFG